MTLAVQDLEIAGLILVTPKRFEDERGFLSEVFNAEACARSGIRCAFVQDVHAFSREMGTVRGLHFQAPPHAQAKLVRVTRGRILDVSVDLRKGSASFGRHVAVELSADNWRQIFIPEGFAHGYCTLEPDTEVVYKVSASYAPGSEGGIRWDDPRLDIDWPSEAGARVSAKDSMLPSLAEIDSPFLYAP